ncbi:hypothetical protein NADFUDRAFT_53684 [Nadsonia fulvescens var. elongata DSM 6958]|uniref:Uncharacterized protein n=1 Tax=Nadsonia fulvescens var. elongata DSM 6958 TaxID=857566 RepID=A0A1E3PD98_9ASCO|nr:hypothetical protein NADFUDRAFT_53684 [Nadsonia fulvescens var. elongata DSM 6958]
MSISLYRSLYRELSHQHKSIMEVHQAGDLAKRAMLDLYRQNSGLPVMSEGAKSGSARYDSSSLREIVDLAKHDSNFAKECLVYLKAQRTYKFLLDRYNPGESVDEQERIRLSARRVGLELPGSIKERLIKE